MWHKWTAVGWVRSGERREEKNGEPVYTCLLEISVITAYYSPDQADQADTFWVWREGWW